MGCRVGGREEGEILSQQQKHQGSQHAETRLCMRLGGRDIEKTSLSGAAGIAVGWVG